jgi:hypothetical protein
VDPDPYPNPSDSLIERAGGVIYNTTITSTTQQNTQQRTFGQGGVALQHHLADAVDDAPDNAAAFIVELVRVVDSEADDEAENRAKEAVRVLVLSPVVDVRRAALLHRLRRLFCFVFLDEGGGGGSP